MNIIKNETSNSTSVNENKIAQPWPTPPQPHAQPSHTGAVTSLPIHTPIFEQPVDIKWIEIDKELFPNISIPRLIRDNEEYLSVKIIEVDILNEFKKIDSPEVRSYGRLNSINLNENECNELNKINNDVGHRYKEKNKETFTTDDSIVKLSDFMEFFNIMKQSCVLKDPKKQDLLDQINQRERQRLQQNNQRINHQQQIIPQNNLQQNFNSFNHQQNINSLNSNAYNIRFPSVYVNHVTNTTTVNNNQQIIVAFPQQQAINNHFNQPSSNINSNHIQIQSSQVYGSQHTTSNIHQVLRPPVYNTTPLPSNNIVNHVLNQNELQYNQHYQEQQLRNANRCQYINSFNQVKPNNNNINNNNLMNQRYSAPSATNLITQAQSRPNSNPTLTLGQSSIIRNITPPPITVQQPTSIHPQNLIRTPSPSLNCISPNLIQQNQYNPHLKNPNFISQQLNNSNNSNSLINLNISNRINTQNTVNTPTKNAESTNSEIIARLKNPLIMPVPTNCNSQISINEISSNQPTSSNSIIDKNISINNSTSTLPSTTSTTTISFNNQNTSDNNSNNINVTITSNINDSNKNNTNNIDTTLTTTENDNHQIKNSSTDDDLNQINKALNGDKILNGSPSKKKPNATFNMEKSTTNINNNKCNENNDNDDDEIFIIEPDGRLITINENNKQAPKNDEKKANANKLKHGIVAINESNMNKVDSYLQIDNYIIPYINLSENDCYNIKRFNLITRKCFKYIPCDLLLKFGFYANKQEFEDNKAFKKVTDQTLIDKMNKLISNLKEFINNGNLSNEFINIDDYELYDAHKNPLEMINLYDVVFFTPRGKPRYVKYLKYSNPFECINRNFKEILEIIGGVLGVKNKSDPNTIKLLPFVKLDNKIIVPHKYLRSYINTCDLHLKNNNSTEDDLKSFIYRTNQLQLHELYCKFTSLMMVYVAFHETSENFEFVDLEPWLTKFNNVFDYNYEFKRTEFPSCWLSKKDIGLLTTSTNILTNHQLEPTTSAFASSSSSDQIQTSQLQAQIDSQSYRNSLSPALVNFNNDNKNSSEQNLGINQVKNTTLTSQSDKEPIMNQNRQLLISSEREETPESDIKKYDNKIKNCNMNNDTVDNNDTNNSNLTGLYRKLKNLTNTFKNSNSSDNINGNNSNNQVNISSQMNNDENDNIITVNPLNNMCTIQNVVPIISSSNDNTPINFDNEQHIISSSSGFEAVKISLVEPLKKSDLASISNTLFESLIKKIKEQKKTLSFRKRSLSEISTKENYIEYLNLKKRISDKSLDQNKKTKIQEITKIDESIAVKSDNAIEISADHVVSNELVSNIEENIESKKPKETNLLKEALIKNSKKTAITDFRFDVPCCSKSLNDYITSDTESNDEIVNKKTRKRNKRTSSENSNDLRSCKKKHKTANQKGRRLKYNDEDDMSDYDTDDDIDSNDISDDSNYTKSDRKLRERNKNRTKPQSEVTQLALNQKDIFTTEEEYDHKAFIKKYKLQPVKLIIKKKLDESFARSLLEKLFSSKKTNISCNQNQAKKAEKTNKSLKNPVKRNSNEKESNTSKKYTTSTTARVKTEKRFVQHDENSNSLPDFDFLN
jgi:hypothetical protein